MLLSVLVNVVRAFDVAVAVAVSLFLLLLFILFLLLLLLLVLLLWLQLMLQFLLLLLMLFFRAFLRGCVRWIVRDHYPELLSAPGDKAPQCRKLGSLSVVSTPAPARRALARTRCTRSARRELATGAG